MSVDVRTREDGPAPPVDAQRFFCESLPDAFAEHRERIAPGAARLRLRPLTIETPDASATVFWRGDRAEVAPGAGPDGGVVWQLTDPAFTDFVRDESTPMAMFSSGRLAVKGGGLGDLLDWWLVLRAALDGRAIHTPGSVDVPRSRRRTARPRPCFPTRRRSRRDDATSCTRPASCTCAGGSIRSAWIGSRPTWMPRRATTATATGGAGG